MMPEAILVLSSSVFLYTLQQGGKAVGWGGVATAPGHEVLDRHGEGTDKPKVSLAQNMSPIGSTEGTGRDSSTQRDQSLYPISYGQGATQPLPSALTQLACPAGKHMTLQMWLKLSHSWAVSTQHNALEINVLAWPVPTWGGRPALSWAPTHDPTVLSISCASAEEGREQSSGCISELDCFCTGE